ncbi:barstar family protein [Methylocaldum gracile]|jgi:RNAse (barnase) inhibitor barstar
MANTEMTFAFIESPESLCGQEDYVLRIPAGIRSKADLLTAFAHAGHFPDYFGGNWDALLDCLRDFSWINNRRVVVVHSDLPLCDNPAECRIYLDILQTVLVDWSENAKAPTAESPPEWPYIDHELRVIFPPQVRDVVASLLTSKG